MNLKRLLGTLFVVVTLVLNGSICPAARQVTVGYEIGAGGQKLEGLKNVSGTGSAVTTDATTRRTGAASLRCITGTGTNPTANSGLTVPRSVGAGTTLFVRAYVNLDHIPGVQTQILDIESNSFATAVSAVLTTTGHLRLFNNVSGLQIGSDSVSVLSAGIWYRTELALNTKLDNSGTDYAELQLDGVSVASSNSLNFGNLGPGNVYVGWRTTGGESNQIINIDDLAVNDSTGTFQTSWPGSGKIVLLKPISDNARTGWVAGAGGTTSLFSAVSNIPPSGAASASETNTSQVKDIVSSTTDNYDANLTSYSTAGLVATDTIALVQAVCDKGDAGTLSARTGALKVVSNPAQSVEDTYDFNSAAAAVGLWPLNWTGAWGTPEYSPSVTLATSPVLRVGKRTATTREVDVDFMGLMVEYTNAVAVSQGRRPLLGVGF